MALQILSSSIYQRSEKAIKLRAKRTPHTQPQHRLLLILPSSIAPSTKSNPRSVDQKQQRMQRHTSGMAEATGRTLTGLAQARLSWLQLGWLLAVNERKETN